MSTFGPSGKHLGSNFKVADDHVVCSGGGEHYFIVGAGAGKFGVALTDFFVFISELACVMCLLSFAFGELPWEGDTTTATAGDRRRGGPGTLQNTSWPASCRA